ncbi:MAG: AEC family transporter [Prevotellaceae bacterium]|jgi:predicted permease|nr:AEC family transporter [Prevotellaceae bacterium]
MKDFLFSFNVVSPLFILMATGYLARMFNFISDGFLKEANRFVFRFSLPLMLFQNIQSNFNIDFSDGSLIIFSLVGVSATILLSALTVPLFVKRRGQRGSMIQAIYRSNFLIYGIPLATGIYGNEAVSVISMMMGIMVAFYNVMAVIILSIYSETGEKFSAKSVIIGIFKNPLILGCLAGMLFGLSGLELPLMLDKPLNDLAGLAPPLALFIMGGEFKFGRLAGNLVKVICASLCRLVLVPAAVIVAAVLLGMRGLYLAALLSLFATPAAVAGYIMADNMGCDGELAAQIVVTTTLASSLSIFLFVYVLRVQGVL